MEVFIMVGSLVVLKNLELNGAKKKSPNEQGFFQ
jgi:hypothetical protein